MLTPRRVLASFALLGSLLGVTACCNTNPDPTSTAKCASQPSSDDCSKCCTAQGRHGHTFVTGSGCKCM